MTPIHAGDLDQPPTVKPRPKGKLPYLPDDLDDPEVLRDWLTLAFRPPTGWRVTGFERTGRDKGDPCLLMVRNGRDSRVYRFSRQGDLLAGMRTTVVGATDHWLRVPHLTGGEIEDVWAALCHLGKVLTEWDERDETRKWIEQLVRASRPMTGHTLVPDGRHAALMALKTEPEFVKADALSMIRPGDAEGYQQRPVRFIDSQTGQQWVRAGETAAFIRWVVGVEPISPATLKARLNEVGVIGRKFEDYRPPHPKRNLYELPEPLGGAQ